MKDILPNILDGLHQTINSKLQAAEHITLITDIWSNKAMQSFLGLIAVIINAEFKRETIVIGLTKMIGAHTAENVKAAIELIVNTFEFNKSKLSSIVTDEGSNLLRLFKYKRVGKNDFKIIFSYLKNAIRPTCTKN